MKKYLLVTADNQIADYCFADDSFEAYNSFQQFCDSKAEYEKLHNTSRVILASEFEEELYNKNELNKLENQSTEQ